MWGRAGQLVLGVIAVVLVRPAPDLLHAPVTAPTFVTEGRAFALHAGRDLTPAPAAPPASRTLHSYVRRASHEFVEPAKRTALIVGINNAAGTPPLPGSVTDARNLHRALVGYGFQDRNITVMLEGEATRPAILGALRSLAKRTPANGLAVFAIATHTSRAGGTNQLATAEGERISAGELAAYLRDITAPAWIALPTCYAAGYALPGIVGFNRVATFASSADRQAYQAGSAGSFLFMSMVDHAMLEGRAPFSVESAFAFAHDELSRDHPNHVPSMSDGYPGDLVLGPVPVIRTAFREPASPQPSEQNGERWGFRTYEADPSPSPTPGRRRGGVGVCGSVRYNCRY